jgi:hypothetical protein
MVLDETMNNGADTLPELALMPMWSGYSQEDSRQDEGLLPSFLLFDDEDEDDIDGEDNFDDMDDAFDDDDFDDDFDDEDDDYEDEDDDFDYEEDVDYDDFDE